MDLFKADSTPDSCCFCGGDFDPAQGPPARVWLDLPAPVRTRIMQEHLCHETCFQRALAPTHRTGSGRPIQRSSDGVILNAAELTPDDLARQRVLCPACGNKTFALWPGGWDSHAAHRCAGVKGKAPETRKQDFRSRFGHLFR